MNAVSVPVGEPVHIISDEPTEESARAALIAAIDELLQEAQKDETFCGLNIDVHRFEGGPMNGKLACIQLVPVDMVGGNTARRV